MNIIKRVVRILFLLSLAPVLLSVDDTLPLTLSPHARIVIILGLGIGMIVVCFCVMDKFLPLRSKGRRVDAV